MRTVFGLLVVLACCFALPPLNERLSLQDSPSLVPKPGVADPDGDGIVVEQVVNVNKTAVIVVLSSATKAGQKQRQLIRDTWMQALNRTSPYSVPKEQRKAFSVWFSVPKVSNPEMMLEIEKEGKIHGDILEIAQSESSTTKTQEFDVYGALFRWVRVAYFEHFSFFVITKDTSFLSISNLNDFLVSKSDKKFFYGGFVNSFEVAPEGYGHEFYAPFVVEGTLVISKDIVEVIARELYHIKQLSRPDATIGSFLMPFELARPVYNRGFVGVLKNLYEPVERPIIINFCPEPLMIALSLPGLDANGKPKPVVVPAQVQNINTRSIMIDPYAKDPEPACGGLNSSPCTVDALRLINDMPK